MRRREFSAGLGAAAVWPAVARAQQHEPVKRIGILSEDPVQGISPIDQEFLKGLAQLGWTEGRNVRIDYRATGTNDPNLIRPHAEALVRAAPDVIFAHSAPQVQVLQRLTSTIPIVFLQSGDPVRSGTVQSIARPGGNLTGFLYGFESSMNTKYLELLRNVAPQTKRVAVVQATGSLWRNDFDVIAAAAQSLAIVPVAEVVRDDAADIERAIDGFAREPGGGLIFPPDIVMFHRRELIVELAARYGLPAVYYNRLFVDAGGLISYGPERFDYRQPAIYVDRILRGTKPDDLPVQRPTKYNLVINIKTAKALGLSIPETLLATADEVIQ
jgi:putative tryptophan/tyrosine transport system substrate-binding protein